MDEMAKEPLQELAKRIRLHAVRMAHHARSPHVASSLSMAELLAVLYRSILRVGPHTVNDPDRDRLILSKGHGIPGVEVSTGALGHGLSIACGLALTAKQDGRPWRVFTVLSDGECDEG